MLSGTHVSLKDLMMLSSKPNHKRLSPIHRSRKPQGEQTSRFRGRGVDFSEVRAYEPGDDIRTIDWKVTARTNKPHTKLFREEQEQNTLVLVDQRQNMFFGSQIRLKSVAAAEAAALAAWSANRRNHRVGGVVIGNNGFTLHKPKQNQKALAKYLSDIASFNQALQAKYQATSNNELRKSLKQLCQLRPRDTKIFLISDYLNSSSVWEEAFIKLGYQNELKVIHIYDPLEERLPEKGRYTVTDGNIRYRFDSDNTKTIARYHKDFTANQIAIKNLCLKFGIAYQFIPTNDPIDKFRWS